MHHCLLDTSLALTGFLDLNCICKVRVTKIMFWRCIHTHNYINAPVKQNMYIHTNTYTHAHLYAHMDIHTHMHRSIWKLLNRMLRTITMGGRIFWFGVCILFLFYVYVCAYRYVCVSCTCLVPTEAGSARPPGAAVTTLVPCCVSAGNSA